MTPTRSLKSLAALGMLSSAVWASTYAAFSDEVSAPSGTFTAGTLDLVATGTPAFTSLLAAGNMKPGDAVYAPLALSNGASLPLTYGMTVAKADATSSLVGDGLPLTVSVKSGLASCSAAGWGGTAVDVVTTDDPIASAGFPGRPLAVSAAETLCFRLQLPSTADNTAQGKTAGVTFRFTAAPTATS